MAIRLNEDREEVDYLWDKLAHDVTVWWEEERYDDDHISVGTHFGLRPSTARIVTERARRIWKEIYPEGKR